MSMRGGSMRGGRAGGGGQRGGRGGTFRGGAGRGPAGPPPIFMKGLPVAQPDPEVTKHENAIIAAPKSASAGLSLQDRLPARPGYGTVGIHITLRTNYFKLEANPDAALYRYTVQFLGPNTDPSKRLKQRCLEMLIADAIFAGTPPATDYANTIITSKKVDFGSEDRKEIVIELSNPGEEPFPSKTPGEDSAVTAGRERRTHRLAVQFDRSIAFKELLDYLHSNLPGAFYPDKADAIQALNIVLGKFARGSHGMIVAGQNKFYMTQAPEMEKLNLGGGLEALRGYYTSVRTSVARLLVNVNVATGAFYKDGPLLELMRHFKDDNNAQDPRFNAKLSAFLKGVRVETSYMKRSDKKTTIKKVKTVLGLCRSPAGGHSKQIKFEYTEPNKPTRNVTVEEYFKIVYNIQLKTPFAPVVNVGSDARPNYLPAELCRVLPGQAARRLLTPAQTEVMLGFAARIPKDNAESIVNKGLVLLGLKSGQSQAQLTSYGLRLPDPQMLTVDGRILPPPTIQYQQSFMPQPGTWNLRGVRFCKPTALPSWALIRAGNPKFEFERPLEEFVKGLKNYGMKYTPFKMTTNFSLMPEETLESRLDNVFTHISAQRITLALFVLPGRSIPKPLYSILKTCGDVKHGIHTVCVTEQKWKTPDYNANVALKINMKLGGVNHYIKPEDLKPLDSKTMVVGIDVTHPSPGSVKGAPSVAGVVASVDGMFAQYLASMRPQQGRVEMVAQLGDMIVERLDVWAKKNQGGLPVKIIVYRDGVSEGQYQTVLEKELTAFQSAFKKKYGAQNKWPKISIIVVGKRHHTRFYPTREEDAAGKGNTKPGTCVDRGVTRERGHDFFLQAHIGLQGTVRPAHYVVIHDENKLGADMLQTLTHRLCYTYGRATKAVSLCPPAYYADLLCERGRAYLSRTFDNADTDSNQSFDPNAVGQWSKDAHPNLTNSMYYI